MYNSTRDTVYSLWHISRAFRPHGTHAADADDSTDMWAGGAGGRAADFVEHFVSIGRGKGPQGP